MTLLPNFGEVSGDFGQLPFPKSPGSRRFAVVPWCKEHLPHHRCGRWHGFHQHGMPRNEPARYHGPEAIGPREGRRREQPQGICLPDPF